MSCDIDVYEVGMRVRIDKCDECPTIVGKIATIKGIEHDELRLGYGRGRPQKDRPVLVRKDDVSLVNIQDVVDEIAKKMDCVEEIGEVK